jgi:transposase
VIKDLNKHHLDHEVFTNEKNGFNFFWKHLETLHIDPKETLFCLEYTGIYGVKILSFLNKKGCLIWMEMGSVIKKSMGLARGKSDKVDAIKIALYAYKNREDVVPWQPPRPVINELKRLLGERNRLITCKNILKNPIQEEDKKRRKLYSTSNKVLQQIIKQIKEIDLSIKLLITSDDKLNEKVKLMTSVPGIGIITASYFICFTNEFTLYRTVKQLACYCGVVPFEHTSGTSIRGRSRVSHMANKRLKTLLHMGALAAIRDDAELKSYYDRKVKEGKNKMLVINAVRNKLVERMVTVLQRKTPYVIKNKELSQAA